MDTITLMAELISPSNVSLVWQGLRENPAHYEIYRAIGFEGQPELLAVVPGTQTAYTDHYSGLDVVQYRVLGVPAKQAHVSNVAIASGNAPPPS